MQVKPATVIPEATGIEPKKTTPQKTAIQGQAESQPSIQQDKLQVQTYKDPSNEAIGTAFTSLMGGGIIGGVTGAAGSSLVNMKLKTFTHASSAFNFGFKSGIVSGAITGAFISSAVNSEIVIGPSKSIVLGGIVGGISGALVGFAQHGKAGALLAGISGAISGSGSGLVAYKIHTLDGGAVQ